jgi:hypothetical protein
VVEKYKPKFPGSSFAKIDRKITIWKVAREEEEEEVADKVTGELIIYIDSSKQSLREIGVRVWLSWTWLGGGRMT